MVGGKGGEKRKFLLLQRPNISFTCSLRRGSVMGRDTLFLTAAGRMFWIVALNFIQRTGDGSR